MHRVFYKLQTIFTFSCSFICAQTLRLYHTIMHSFVALQTDIYLAGTEPKTWQKLSCRLQRIISRRVRRFSDPDQKRSPILIGSTSWE